MLLFKCDLIIPNEQNYFCLANLLWKKVFKVTQGDTKCLIKLTVWYSLQYISTLFQDLYVYFLEITLLERLIHSQLNHGFNSVRS